MVGNVSGIYQIKNKINRRIYIGSAEFIRERWINHVSLLRRGKHHSIHLQNSWNKYGEKNFEISIIERCPKSELIYKEQFYLNKLLKADLFITKKDSYFIKHGMNIKPVANPGFFGTHSLETIIKMLKKKCLPILAISPSGVVLGSYISSGFAAKNHKVSVEVVRKSIKNRQLNKQNVIGFMYENLYEAGYIPKPFVPHNKGKKLSYKVIGSKSRLNKGRIVYLYNIYGEFLKEFPAIASCARYLKMTVAGTHKKLNKINALRKDPNSAMYLILTKKNSQEIKELKTNYKRLKNRLHTLGKTRVCRLDGGLVGYGKNDTEISKILGVSIEAIQAVKSGKRNQWRGYKFSKA